MPDRFSRYKLKFFFILVSSFLFSAATAQSDEEVPVIDTLSKRITTEITTENEDYVFDSIFERNEKLVTRELPDSVYDHLRMDKDYWYVNQPPPRIIPKKKKQNETETGWLENNILKNIVLILIIALFVGAVIWFLASANIKLFDAPKKLLENEDAEITEEDLFNINYENEIRNAVLASNFRLAIRLWYLRTLKELTGKNLISYRHEKTNTEYLDELYGTTYHNDFRKLTRNFEYAWYGKFELNENAYQVIEKEFAEFNRHMK
jgi:hypothetical protein